MKRMTKLMLLGVTCVLFLAGCACEHQWKEADCVTPKTCTECEETEGEALGHKWVEATCTEPKTCDACGLTEGDNLGHDMAEATCTDPRTCTRCGSTKGEALGHDWADATTETPKTCMTCGLTEGEPIVTDPRFTTANAKELLGLWVCPLELDPEMIGLTDFEEVLGFYYALEFGPAGEFALFMDVDDPEIFGEAIIQVGINSAYAEFEAIGYSRESADAQMQAEVGMNVDEYILSTMEGMEMSEIIAESFGSTDIFGVYYVEDGQIYIGLDWESEMEPSAYSLSDDGWLYIDAMTEVIGIEAGFYLAE